MFGQQFRTPIALLLVAFVAAASFLSVVIPLGEAADEVSHHSYVRYMAEYGGLPPVVEGTTVYGETFQPPLYYALAAPLTTWLPTGSAENLGFDIPVENNPDFELNNRARARVLLQPADARWVWQGEALGWHLVRLLSVLLGAATVYFTYRLGQVVWVGEKWTPWIAALFVAALPSFAGVSAAVTNDALATMLGAALLWQLARLVTTDAGTDWRQWALAGLFGALGVWTKASGWLFVGTVLTAALLRWRSERHNRHALRGLGTAGVVWLAGALPLWWLNLQRSGDLLGRNLQAQVTEGRTDFGAGAWGDVLVSLMRTWWAGYGGAVHLSFNSVLSFGLVVLVFGVAVWGLTRRHLKRDEAPDATQQLIPFLAAHTGLVLLAWLGWTMLVMGTGQGRLLFPALPAIAVLVAGGWAGLPAPADPRAPTAPGMLAILMGILFVQSVTSLVMPTYRTDPIPEIAPTEGMTYGRWQAGESGLALTGFAAPVTVDSRTLPGEIIPVYLAWEATDSLPDLRARLRWIDREGNVVGAPKEGSPIANHPLTDEWAQGRYSATHNVVVPQGLAPGYYRLMLSVVGAEGGAPLPMRGEDGSAGDEIMVAQTTVVAP